jgi:hypothetical protein
MIDAFMAWAADHRERSSDQPMVGVVLANFDPSFMEVMVTTTSGTERIKFAMTGAATDYEDDRELVLDGPDGFASWDGHRGQYVRGRELCERFVVERKDGAAYRRP